MYFENTINKRNFILSIEFNGGKVLPKNCLFYSSHRKGGQKHRAGILNRIIGHCITSSTFIQESKSDLHPSKRTSNCLLPI